MRERFKLWSKTKIKGKFYIVRNEIIPWKFYYQHHTVNRFVLGKEERLKCFDLFKGFIFGSSSENDNPYNVVISYVIFKLLTLLNQEKFKYRRIPVNIDVNIEK